MYNINYAFQGIFIFLFYIVLNEPVKSYWLVKLGYKENFSSPNVLNRKMKKMVNTRSTLSPSSSNKGSLV